ncbi:multifunctional CCA addition/repair protein [Parathalassolituus penaei]|uniref:Multifunctional CCA protein n=1 Tax=Parathalassolituus penaei TaxID=2997323 RepID=A0A9X3IS80_9GAMM|nr:multifunctional CCA addition/repair protein [Parathalassolituus penaei]MCY0963878.1 multifunctional CCA addition/repair protein [Parathalassolituus penaei]
MQIYLVGGAVRDQLLGITVKDRDWMIVGAEPQQLLDLGYQQVGADFPVFLHPQTHEEYALARTERKSGHGYQGFDCRFSPDVTLEQDLLRRDLTINAIAMDENGQLYDPYQGQRDLEQRLLRHVSPAFSEDPLRVLRVARFAARFANLGFQVAAETMQLMQQMVADGELEHLVAERVWQETRRALGEDRPDVYFQVLRECGALALWFGEIDALFGVPQPPQHHPEIDCGIHALMSLQAAVRLSDDTAVRWAALTHDLGKALTPESEWPRHIAHEARGKQPLKRLSERLKAPKDATELALLGCEWHTHVHRALELKAATILKLLDGTDAWRRPERFEQLLVVATADSRGRTGFENVAYPQADYLRTAFELARQVSAKDMVARGLTGKAIGEALAQEREQQLGEWISQQRQG